MKIFILIKGLLFLIGAMVCYTPSAYGSGSLNLTDQEKRWLEANPVIRLASDPAWPPFEAIDPDGSYYGIAADYIRLIEQRLGVTFETSPRRPWAEIVALFKNDELDVLTCAMDTSKRREFAVFTAPYIVNPMVIVTNADIGYIDGMGGLVGKTVGYEAGYAPFDKMMTAHPELKFVPFPDSKSAMMAVSSGEVFAYIGNIATVSYLAASYGLSNVKVSGQTPYSYELSMGVRKEMAQLVPILQKALNSISAEEKNQILQKWFTVKVDTPVDYKLVAQIVGVVLLAFIAILYWNRRLAKEIGLRAQIETKLRSNQVLLTQRSRELVAALEEAQLANNAKSDFLSSMSHELRTPLNAILGFAQLLDMDTQLSEDNKSCVKEMLHAGGLLLDMVEEVLDLSQLEGGHVDISLEAVLLKSAVEECLNLTLPQADKMHVELINNIDQDCLIKTDVRRIKQVLLNLMSNAVKYNRQGGSVTVRAALIDGGMVRIYVIDTGKGIPNERKGELFQPFKRLGYEMSDISGSGVGLLLTRRLVELLGGDIGFESEKGIGSTFWIDIPLDESGVGEAITVDDSGYVIEPAEPGTGSVLYIEDNKSNLNLVSKYVSEYRALQFYGEQSPSKGLVLAQEVKPDIIFVDINLPEMSGYEVLRVIQSDESLRHIPVVAISANAKQSDISKGLAAGFSDYLVKPVDLSELSQVIERLLQTDKIG